MNNQQHPITLSMDTSFIHGSMALIRGQMVLAQRQWTKEKSHSETITSHLKDILEEAKISISDIGRLVCGVGPGSFTGVRVSLSLAKSLAYSLSCPLITVETGFAMALLDEKTTTPIVSLTDAQKNKVFCGIYQKKNKSLVTKLKPILVSPSELNTYLTEASYTCVGNGLGRLKPLFSTDILNKLLPIDILFPMANKTALYVEKYYTDFQTVHWKDATPLYLRKSSAEEVLNSK